MTARLARGPRTRRVVAWAVMLLLSLLWLSAVSALAAEFHDAVRSGDVQRVENLLDRGADKNQRDEWGRTPLIVALQQDRAQAAALLLRRGVDPSLTDAWGRTALLVAAQLRNNAAIEALIAARADVNAANRNDITPLIAAAQTGNREALAMLVRAGAALDRQDNLGWSALMWAAYRKDEPMVRLLIEAGADASLPAWDDARALDVARRSGAEPPLVALLTAATPSRAPAAAIQRTPPTRALEILAAPKVVTSVEPGRLVRGNAAAPITIVEFTDLQCPYCAFGARVMDEVLARYEGRVRLVLKHLPLPRLHPMALPAGLHVEAIALQSPARAWAFHDRVMREPRLLAGGEPRLRELAAELGVDAQRLDADLRSEFVRARIDADLKEAQRLRLDGVPAFVVDGHLVAGAQPAQLFFDLIEALLHGGVGSR